MTKSHRPYSVLPIGNFARTYAEVSMDSLKYNYRLINDQIRKSGSDCKLISVVKADAYGHGVCSVVPTLLKEGCDCFAVSSIEEAVEVRRSADDAGYHPTVLILGYTLPSLARALSDYDLTQALISFDYSRMLNSEAVAAGRHIKCHVAINTGMNRIGLPARNDDEIEKTVNDIATISDLGGIGIDGMFTHFSKADEEDSLDSDSSTRKQFSLFSSVISGLEKKGKRPKLCHACNSAGILRFPEYYLDGVRLGISLYGAQPSDFVFADTKPVMKLKTTVANVFTLPKGESLSYGGIYSSDSDRRIATLTIGYADGLLRCLSGSSVTFDQSGEKGTIVGRICMDQCMVDITDIEGDVKLGDTVTVFGSNRDIKDLASRAGTIEYEILCLLSARVVRYYV